MAMLAIAMTLFFWRLSNGPIELDGNSAFLRNIFIRQGISDYAFFENSVLTWRSADNNPTGRGSFEVRFTNIEIENPKTSLQLIIPKAGMQFSSTALLRGVIAPTYVEFSGLELHLVVPKEVWANKNTTQEAFVAAIKAYLDRFNNSQNLVPRLAKQILTRPSPRQSTGYLQQLLLANTHIKVTDEISNEVWNIPDALLDIKRVDEGLSLLLEGEIDIEDKEDIPLHLSVQYNIEAEKANTQIRFSNFIPTDVAGKVEGLLGLSTLNVPISGIIDFYIDKELLIPTFDFEFDISQGMINPAALYNDPVKIDELGVTGQYIGAQDSLYIEDFHLIFDGAELNVEGIINDVQHNPEILMSASLLNMPLINLKTYWPPQLLVGARIWIDKNITGGMITDGKFEVAIRPDMWALPRLPDQSFKFDFNIEDASSHFLKPMPQLTQVSATARLMLNHLILNIKHGLVKNVEVKDVVLHFNDISHKGDAIAHFEIPIVGKVEEILNIIDYKPLGYPSLYGIKENSILGKAEAHLTLDFPLIRNLKLSKVGFKVEADVEELNIAKLSDSFSLSDGTMNITVERKGITANGDVLINGVALNAEWVEDFTKESIYPTTYIIDGTLENKDWEKLHLPFEPYVMGSAKVNLVLKGKGSSLEVGNGNFDLVETEIQFDPLSWKKDIGEEGGAIFNLQFVPDGLVNVNDIIFVSDKLNSHQQLSFDDQRVTRLYVKDLKMSGMDFSALFDWDKDKSLYQVSMSGDKFNAVPLMDIVLATDDGSTQIDLPDYNFTGVVKNMAMYNDINMTDASIAAGYSNNEIVDFDYLGIWGLDKNLSIIIANSKSGENADINQQKLTLTTNDAGVGLRSLDFFNGGNQGELVISADMTRQEQGLLFAGTIKASKFRVGNSALFSELLKEKEFAKAQEELKVNGLSFDSFDGEFEQYNGVMTLKSGSAIGPTLGVTVDGFIDQKFDEVALNGTIIPAYGINSFFSNIPLIGTILAGAKGEGVFSATYEMTGSIDDPKVSINPLMVLAPGIFRKIFGALGRTNKKSAREEAEEAVEAVKDLP